MKTLLLLRGVAGSGKSTIIKKYKLEPYTISTDIIRDLFSSPVLGLDGKFQMDMANNSEVWKKTYELVERRMRNGDFTVVDATHVFGNLGNYVKLADKYKYRVFCYTVQSTLENALKQNQERPEHKIVPEEIVAKQYKLMQEQEINSKITMVDDIEDVLLETTNDENIVDANNYEKVVVIGDIQSCFDPLEEVLRD